MSILTHIDRNKVPISPLTYFMVITNPYLITQQIDVFIYFLKVVKTNNLFQKLSIECTKKKKCNK